MSTMRRIGNAWVNLDLVEAIVPDKFSPEKHVVFSRGHIITAEISKDDLDAAFVKPTPTPPDYQVYELSKGDVPPDMPKKHKTTADQIYNLSAAEYAELKELDDKGYLDLIKWPKTEHATAAATDETGKPVLVETRNTFAALERVDGRAHYIPELVMRYEAKL